MTQRQPLVAGNWKMNGTNAQLTEVQQMVDKLSSVKCAVMICPPATLLSQMHQVTGSSAIMLGGQDCHAHQSGAHTGDISAAQLKDCGAVAVIAGHSERRNDHNESDETVKTKAQAAHDEGLMAIICVGETLEERQAEATIGVVGGQLTGSLPSAATSDNTIIAYEPVWAIGSGLTPTVEQVAQVHKALRERLEGILGPDSAAKMRILYGGSVKPTNAVELMGIENVDGALVGGASLKAADFMGIIAAYS